MSSNRLSSKPTRWRSSLWSLGPMRNLCALLPMPPARLAAQRAASPAPPAPSGRIAFEELTVPNGLRVIYSEDHFTPIVSVDVWYEVGSRNERPGRSGFAHLFEHMMFQGSAHIKKAEHNKLIERAGGDFNGSTAEDRTDYWETAPSNRLNLALWAEGDRMRSPANTQRCDATATGTAPRRREVRDAQANLDAVLRIYRVPDHRHADTPALEILNIILGQGESSRLNVSVVRREKAAVGSGAILNPFGS